MTFPRRQSHIVLFTAILVSTQIWLPAVIASGDRGSGSEFKSEGNAGNATVKVDREMASKLGLKIEPVRQQSFGSSIKATGQLEALPSQKSEITAPVKGKIISLAVQPGATVKRGQTLAVMNSADLADLRVTSQEKTAEAKSALQQAQVDLRLAQDNYRQYQKIGAAEIAQAKSQLTALQSVYDRDRLVVNQRSILNAAQASYAQQQQIAKSGIEQAQVELAVAQERYDRDRQLMASGALAQRQVLESQAIATAKGVRTYYNRLSIALAVGAGFVLKLSVNFGHL